MNTEYWLRKFADEIEQNGHLNEDNYEIYKALAPSCHWGRPDNPEHLIRTALRSPHNIRIARRRITISGPGGTYSYPEPVREAPKNGTRYFVPLLKQESTPFSFNWGSCTADYAHLHRGRVHLDEESAREHSRAEIQAAGFTP